MLVPGWALCAFVVWAAFVVVACRCEGTDADADMGALWQDEVGNVFLETATTATDARVFVDGTDVGALRDNVTELSLRAAALERENQGLKDAVQVMREELSALAARTCSLLPPTVNTTPIHPASPSGAFGWAGAVAVPGGMVFGVPSSAEAVLIIDPATGAADTTSISGLGTDVFKWANGVYSAVSQLIYCFPDRATSMLIINPATLTADTTTLANTGAGWISGAAATAATGAAAVGPSSSGGGKIYAVPWTASHVLVIDPATNTFSTTAVTNLPASSMQHRWHGAVLTNQGTIVAIPHNEEGLVVIDAARDEVSSVVALPDDLLSVPAKFQGGVLGPNGHVYAVPSSATSVLVFDPATEIVTLFEIPDVQQQQLGNAGKWVGGVLVPGTHKIFCMPSNADSVLVIDTRTNTADATSLVPATLAAPADRFFGAAAADTGVVFGMPRYEQALLTIDTRC